MPGYLITACWAIIFLFVIYRYRFFKIEGIHPFYTIVAFLFKICLGFANYYIWLHIIGHGDSLRYVHDAQLVYGTLPEHPGHFFELLVGHSTKSYVPEHLKYITENLYIEWHVSEYHIVRLLAIINVFSFGSPWGNIVILSFILFSASTALFKTVIRFYGLQSIARIFLFAVIFFIPSIIFWSSGLLKEGVTLILLIILFIQVFRPRGAASWTRPIIIIIVLFFTWLIRDYVFLITTFNLAIWLLVSSVKKLSARPLTSFAAISVFCLVGIILLALVYPDLNIAAEIKSEQSYFLNSAPDPDYSFKALDGTYPDLLKKLPYAANNILFRPNLLHSSDPFRIYQSVELILLLGFFVFCLVRRKKPITLSVAGVFFFFLSIELLVVYGLMVTDADSLSRYRTIPLFFLLILAVARVKPKVSL